MERIKKALDRAKSSRDSLEPTIEKRVGPPEERYSGLAKDGRIAYQQTRVCKLDPVLLHENRILSAGAEREAVAAYKMLRTQVMQRMTAQGWNVLAVTSPGEGDGKTTTAINLALSLAQEFHHTVLLVDMDLQKPSIHRYLGLNVDSGIEDFLLAKKVIGEILVNPGVDRLVILPGRSPVSNSSEVLASPAMGELVKELKTRYPSRIVIFDMPPVLSADDALSFSPYVDAFLLVAREGQTTSQGLAHAVEILDKASILGVVVNGSNERAAYYY